MRHKILVVDDELEIRELARDFLKEEYDVLFAADGSEAIQVANETKPSLIVLDLLMPVMDGMQACETLRDSAETKQIPVIILTALKDSADKIKAFRAGADDYLTKPFHPEEFRARVAAKIRRFDEMGSTPSKSSDFLVCGNLKMNLRSKEVYINSGHVWFTRLEFELLEYLVRNRDKLSTRKEIIDKIWDSPEVKERALDPHILAVRKKLAKFNYQIVTVYGGGFILKPV